MVVDDVKFIEDVEASETPMQCTINVKANMVHNAMVYNIELKVGIINHRKGSYGSIKLAIL